jgi:hypothetical protein
MMKFSHCWMSIDIQSRIPPEEKLRRVAEMYDAMIAL